MNFLGSFGGIVAALRTLSRRDWLILALWFALSLALSFLLVDVSLPLRLLLSGLFTWCLIMTSWIGVLSDRVAYNDTKFEIADQELVRVSALVGELEQEVSDLKSKLDAAEQEISDIKYKLHL